MTIEYIGYREENLRRVARRLGLHFHIDCWLYGTNKLLGHGMLTEHAGHKSETREATDAELQMWLRMIPDGFNPEELPATPKEVEDSFRYRKGPFTINATDFQAFRGLRDNFDPCVERVKMLTGLFGWFSMSKPKDPLFQIAYRGEDDPDARPVYVSRQIPVGFFYEGHHPELHYIPVPGAPRQLAPEIPAELIAKVGMSLEPFQVD